MRRRAVLVACALLAATSRAQSGGLAIPNAVITRCASPSTPLSDCVRPVSHDELCTPGAAARARNVPYEEKSLIFAAYFLPTSLTPVGLLVLAGRAPVPQDVGLLRLSGSVPALVRRQFVVDHLIPIELGGNNTPANLWPQPREEAKGKDVFEDALHFAVCNNELTLSDAQERIRRDWRTAMPSGLHFTARQTQWLRRDRSYGDE